MQGEGGELHHRLGNDTTRRREGACLPVSSKQRSAPCSRLRSCLGVERVGPAPTSGTGSPKGPSPLLGTCLGDRLALELLGQATVEETPGHPPVPTKQLAAILQGCECSGIHPVALEGGRWAPPVTAQGIRWDPWGRLLPRTAFYRSEGTLQAEPSRGSEHDPPGERTEPCRALPQALGRERSTAQTVHSQRVGGTADVLKGHLESTLPLLMHLPYDDGDREPPVSKEWSPKSGFGHGGPVRPCIGYLGVHRPVRCWDCRLSPNPPLKVRHGGLGPLAGTLVFSQDHGFVYPNK